MSNETEPWLNLRGGVCRHPVGVQSKAAAPLDQELVDMVLASDRDAS